MSREIMQQVLCIIKLLRTHDNEQATEKLELISAFEQELAKLEPQPKREWLGLTDGEIQCILDCGRGEFIAIKKAEQRLKDKNTTHHLQHDK
jgi:hypothetical protein